MSFQTTARYATGNQFLARPNQEGAVPPYTRPLYPDWGSRFPGPALHIARYGRLGRLSSLSASATQAVGQAGSIASGVIPGILVAGKIISATGPWGLVIGGAIMGVTMGIQALLNSGCGQSCVVTSNWANEAAALLEKNVHAYFSNAVRTQSMQAQALANFDSIWQYLAQQCGQAGLGPAGQRCITDRQAGACVWHAADDANAKLPGAPIPGECWNWFNGYRDPIAHDTEVVSDTQGQNLTASGQGPGPTDSGPLGGLKEVLGPKTFPILLGVGVLILALGMGDK